MKKSTRTISGVTPVAVMARPMGCPGQCVYCPTYAATPRSYTPESPAVLRARECDYEPKEQVRLRLKVLADMGHPTDKIELIVMGGTFLAGPVDYQYEFIKACYDALNGEDSATLEDAKQLNENASHRCVGLCLETRPDWCGPEQVARMLEFGATRVELGVQTLDDAIYELVRRGHGVEAVVRATQLLKEHGFKVHYHWMPGLPGSTPEKDLALSRQLFEDPRFRPDGLKIYPTMVVSGTELEKWFQAGRYQPYDNETMTNLVAEIKSIVPRYVRISRILRDIPPKFIVGGLKDSLRGVVRERMKQAGTECHCIRCREYGHRLLTGGEIGEPLLIRMDYEASGGKEVLLSFEDERETLFGLLRLRVQSKPILPAEGLGRETNGPDGIGAIIRELHVYGPEVPLKQSALPVEGRAVQHKGFGRALVAEAERLAREEFQARQMVVLSGVGAREYYRTPINRGYRSLGDYMVKSL
ncbi:MAG: tRNA uridine(34) 5-carboxymethylaminomethyl modification radical SAM/GNAT enzyme Elp3 [Dehalococcoidales bacterium]|nr:tRNA uridine(34) 5-carboxymethylaminomethyl modification radical SAM/GNAT enzyme Elp3 [Dehalococcoidales bacterium]